MKRSLNQIADDFFGYLGEHFPQQCASDEFYFLPRSEAAIQYLNNLDDLSPEQIHGHIQYVQDLVNEIPSENRDDPEAETDRLFLRQGMKSFVREFKDAEIWKNDPTLYIKIPLFATDHVVSQSHWSTGRVKESLLSIFSQVPNFLDLGIKNLDTPSEISLETSLDMTRDAIEFYGRDVRAFIEEKMKKDKHLLSENTKVLGAWEVYKKGLFRLTPGNSFALGEGGLRKILSTSLSYTVSLEEIREIAQQAYQKIVDKLDSLAKKIDRKKGWKYVIYEKPPSVTSSEQVMDLYEKEVQNLRRFFISQDTISFPPGEDISVQKIPSYLQSLRATASYKAPLTGGIDTHGVFYINPGKEGVELMSSHCPYLSAHETYPGHHILDHIRIHHPNPIRRQIESPLFYEGWACYAEQLLDEQGYIRDPRQRLVGLKRRLWRCLRAILDVELHTGKIGLSEGAERIERLGFSSQTAQRQIRRFALTPGYQLCYFMGVHEIIRLRERFYSNLGPKTFHDTILNGGELPFDLVEKRLETRALRKK